MAKKENKIMVERETFEKNGKSYYSYFIKGNIRVKDVRVLITPPIVSNPNPLGKIAPFYFLYIQFLVIYLAFHLTLIAYFYRL